MSELTAVKLGHINLRGDIKDDDFAAAVESVLGQPLPFEPNTVTCAAHRIYWLGPDEWQIVAEPGDTQNLLRTLRERLDSQHVAINDLSGGQMAYHLAGPDVPDLLSRGCTLDLHPSALRLGDCAQSGLAKALMLLGYIDEAPVYEIIVRRSFSEYVLRWLRQT